MINQETFLEFAAAIKAENRKKAQDPVAYKLKQRGIDITKLRRQKNSMRSAACKARYNAAGSKLKIINDAREEAARQKRMANPRYERAIKHLVEAAEKKVEEDEKIETPKQTIQDDARPRVKILREPIIDAGSSRGYPFNLDAYDHKINPSKYRATNRGKNPKSFKYYW